MLLSKYFIAVILAFLTCMQVSDAAEKKLDESPFWNDEIEITPGQKMLLKPRLIDAEGIAMNEYKLQLELPEGIKKNKTTTSIVDAPFIPETEISVKDIPLGQKISYKPDLSMAVEGANLYLVFLRNENGKQKGMGYFPTIKFQGSFDWQKTMKIITAPQDATAVLPILWKKSFEPVSGLLEIKQLTIQDQETGEMVFDYKPTDPKKFELQNTVTTASWFNPKRDIKGNRKYIVSCEARGEKIISQISHSLKDNIYRCRVLVFDVSDDIKLPAIITWSIVNDKNEVFKTGQIKLIKAPTPMVPKELDCSVWTCETRLDKEPKEIRQIYLEKFKEWGLNRVEPEMAKFEYPASLDKKALFSELADEASAMNFKVRGRSQFFAFNAAEFLKKYPGAKAFDYKGNVISADNGNYMPVCVTWLLDGDKFDKNPGQVRGGSANPLVAYYIEYIKSTFKYNNIDGLFFDFEISPGPYVKCRPAKDKSRNWTDTSCICERCRKAFTQYAALDHIPSVEEICNTGLYEKWIDFRCFQNSRTWKLWRNTVKEITSSNTFSIYSGESRTFTKQQYGVDFKLAAETDCIDFMMNRLGDAGKEVEKLYTESLCNALTTRPFIQLQVFTYTDQNNVTKLIYFWLPLLKNRIIRTVVIGGSRGWSFNGVWGIDDQLTKPIREANEFLAKNETLFLKGSKMDFSAEIQKMPSISSATWRSEDGKFHTFIFNDNTKPQKVTIARNGEQFEIEVPARDLVVHNWPE